jgi:O-antigen ligase
MKAKKPVIVPNKPKEQDTKKEGFLSFPIIVSILYLFVHFIPELESKDPIGPQWLYVSVIDLVFLCYCAIRFNKYIAALKALCSNLYFIIFIAFIAWASASIYYAINPTEAVVCLARVITTFFAVFNLVTVFYKQENSIVQVFKILTVILFIESATVLISFYKQATDLKLDELILNLYGNNGNKNIMAASIAIKIPFCLYFLYTQKESLYKFFIALALSISFTALFILNTRSTFVSILTVSILYIIVLVVDYVKQKDFKQLGIQIAFLLIPFFIGIGFSNFSIQYSKSNFENEKQGYGSFTERLATIDVTNGGSSGRIKLWMQAYDYFNKHAFVGCGYGNWKLASIPYDKIDLDTFTMSYHTHNDFIEIAAELGVVGVLLYIAIFSTLFFFVFKVLRSPITQKNKTVILFAFFALVCYLFDALLNFPSERTIIQTLLVIIVTFIITIYLSIQKTKDIVASKSVFAKFLLFIALIIMVGGTYVTYQTYRSFVGQRIVFSEFSTDPKIPLDDVKDLFPSIPNLSYAAFPLKQALARYYIRDKDYATALQLIDQSEKDNPYLFYGDFLKTYIYGIQGKDDSSYFYAKKSFYERPRTMSYYQNLLVIATKLKDTIEMGKAFKTFRQYRNEPQVWAQYIQSMYYLKGASDDHLKGMTDSAVYYFPKDTLVMKTNKIIYNK